MRPTPTTPLWPRPGLLVLTDRTASARPLPEVVAAAVAGGATTVLLREKDLPVAERARLADTLRDLLAPVGGRLVLAGTALAGDAMHLAARDHRPEPRPALLGRSCHNADDVGLAAVEGCDWVTVSPVHATPSKPGYGPALGRAGLSALSAVPGAPPVYGLGGITAANARACLVAGAHGVAVMGAVMRAPRPDQAVAALLAALAGAVPAGLTT